jgi:hypothetical protein
MTDGFGVILIRKAQSDPNLTVAILQSGQSAKSRLYELDAQKAAFGEFNQTWFRLHAH